MKQSIWVIFVNDLGWFTNLDWTTEFFLQQSLKVQKVADLQELCFYKTMVFLSASMLLRGMVVIPAWLPLPKEVIDSVDSTRGFGVYNNGGLHYSCTTQFGRDYHNSLGFLFKMLFLEHGRAWKKKYRCSQIVVCSDFPWYKVQYPLKQIQVHSGMNQTFEGRISQLWWLKSQHSTYELRTKLVVWGICHQQIWWSPIGCQGLYVQGNFLLLCSSTNFVGCSYSNDNRG